MTTADFTEAEHITIPRPHVPYGPGGVTTEQADADYLREAARKLEEHYKPFGSNLRATVVKLVRDAADAVEAPRTHLAAQEPSEAARAVRALHRQFGVYAHEDACPDTSDEHREAHHHEDSDGYGEEYCDQRPLYTLCDHCRDESGERLDWPCATIQALDSARTARRDEETR